MAMKVEEARAQLVAQMVFDMEEDCRDVRRWGDLVTACGSSESAIRHETLMLVGREIYDLGKRLEDWFEALLENTRGEQEARS